MVTGKYLNLCEDGQVRVVDLGEKCVVGDRDFARADSWEGDRAPAKWAYPNMWMSIVFGRGREPKVVALKKRWRLMPNWLFNLLVNLLVRGVDVGDDLAFNPLTDWRSERDQEDG